MDAIFGTYKNDVHEWVLLYKPIRLQSISIPKIDIINFSVCVVVLFYFFFILFDWVQCSTSCDSDFNRLFKKRDERSGVDGWHEYKWQIKLRNYAWTIDPCIQFSMPQNKDNRIYLGDIQLDQLVEWERGEGEGGGAWKEHILPYPLFNPIANIQPNWPQSNRTDQWTKKRYTHTNTISSYLDFKCILKSWE